MIGNFFRSGKLYAQERIRVNDHDFRSLAEGMAVPHGLYDIYRNIGYVTIGVAMTPLNLLALVFATGGSTMVNTIIYKLHPSYFCVIVAGATMLAFTCSTLGSLICKTVKKRVFRTFREIMP